MKPGALERVIDALRSAGAQGTSLVIRGSGSHDALLGASKAKGLDLRDHCGILAYEPSELYVRVAAGTRLSELEQTLEVQRQDLPFEPPRFSSDATVGGMVASGLAGPSRMASGPLRNFLLGVTVVDGEGRLLRLGGTVIKNVAGYDVSRLYAGSFGTLGILMDVVLRVAPSPPCRETVSIPMRQAEALALLTQIRQTPWPIDASVYLGALEGRLWLRLQGSRSALDEARTALARAWPLDIECPENAARFWADIRDQRHAFFKGTPQQGCLWRVSLPPKTPPLDAGFWLIEWHGGLRWSWRGYEGDGLVDLARQQGGSAARFGGGPRDAFSWPRGAISPVQQRLEDKLRRTLDPNARFEGPFGRVVT